MKKSTQPILLLGLLLAILSLPAQKQDWRWQNPFPQGNTLRNSFFLDKNTGLMVGDAGTILKTKDGGKNWEKQESGTKANLYAIHFRDSTLGIATGTDGTILSTRDCGKSWKKLNSGRKDTLRGVSILNAKKIICVGDTGTIIRSNDGGNTWVYTPFPGLKSNLNDVFFPAPDFGSIVGDSFPSFGGPPIIFSGDSGKNFSPWGGGNAAFTGININAVWMPEKDPDKAILVGDEGTIVSTTTAGQTLSKPISPVTVNITDVWFFDGNNGFATGPLGTLLRTKDCGDTWSLITPPSPLNREILTVAFPDSSKAYFGGGNGLQFGTDDGGLSFTPFQIGFFPNFTDVAFLDDSFGVAVGGFGAVLRTPNGGKDWISPPFPPTFHPFESVTTTRLPEQRNKLWAAGGTYLDTARIFCSVDSGISWTPQRVPSPFKFFDITFYDSLRGFAVGLDGALFCTQNGGKTWVKKNGNTTNWLLDVEMPNDSTIFAVGGFGTIIRSPDFGNTWNPLSSGTQEWLTSVSFIDDSFGVAVGNHGVVLRTQDRGDSWFDVSPPKAAEIDFTDVSLTRADFASNKNGSGGIGVTAVGFNGVIYYSPDFGDTWIEQNSGTNFPLWGCYFLDSLKGWAVGEFGTILHTDGHVKTNVSIDEELERPRLADLGSCYPNPTYSSTTIPFELKAPAQVHLAIYDWNGRLIQTLIQEKRQAGKYEQLLEVGNLAQGFYVYRLKVGEELFVKRLIVLN